VIIILFISFIAISAWCFNTNNESSDINSNDSYFKKHEIKKNTWEYSEEVDKMEGTKRYVATLASLNKLEFSFPYNGGSQLSIMVKNSDGREELFLHISKGQMLRSYFGKETIKFKFDDEKPVKFSYNTSTNNSNDYAFFDNSKEIINKLKQAKKIMIEAYIFQEGNQVFEFEQEGFKWRN
jgi:hypothetical protein